MSAVPPLTHLLADVLHACPSRAAVRDFVALCHRIAKAHLLRKQHAGRLRTPIVNGSLDALAMDCVADLFARDAQGRFPELCRYYEEIGWADLDDDALVTATRRLVFSATNDRLFACYHEADPSLANLIRALKRAAPSAGITLERRHGQLWIVAGDDADAPLMPPEFLEAYLTRCSNVLGNGAEALTVAVHVLRSTPHYRSAYPLTPLALLIRRAAVHVQEAPADEPPAPLLQPAEVERAVIGTTARVKSRMWRYVEQGKLDEATYEIYFEALRDRLAAEYVPPGNPELTNHRALQQYCPDLSRAAYGREHRAVFEYLWKQLREAFERQVRALFSEGAAAGQEVSIKA